MNKLQAMRSSSGRTGTGTSYVGRAMNEEGVVSSRMADQQQEQQREEKDYETPAFLRKKLLNNNN